MKIFLLFAFILIGLNTKDISDSEEQKMPFKRILRNANSITTLKIQFCQSWSSAGYFNYVKEQLESLFSDIKVIAEKYPLKNPRKMIYNIMIGIEIFLIILIVFSGLIQSKLEILIGPEYFKIINENKIGTIGIVYFIGLYIGQFINQTGAFEVFCDDKLIWSTIDNNGTKPSLKSIILLIKKWNKI